MFIDLAEIEVVAGSGGDGQVSWRREKFVDRGGPTGGDGGDGGSVVFRATVNDRSLARFRHQRLIRATNGRDGRPGSQHGARGQDQVVDVPVGTIVSQLDDQTQLADLAVDGQQVVIARGGVGGFGNAHFKSSRRQAPQVAEKGSPGQRLSLRCELKLLADVGLIGQPNAGKSTFLRAVTAARPKVADYPFTTLEPHLGVAEFDETSLLLADIPGLIEGAFEGKGLGHQFLRHIERNRLILHLIDCQHPDPVMAYRQIRHELASHSQVLGQIPEIVVLTKVDTLSKKETVAAIGKLKKAVPAKTPTTTISSWDRLGLLDLLRQLRQHLDKLPEPKPADDPDKPVVIGLEPDPKAWRASCLTNGNYLVVGGKIDLFAAKTRFDSLAGRQRLRDIMHKMGIKRELVRQGCQNQTIVFGRPEIGRLSLFESEGD